MADAEIPDVSTPDAGPALDLYGGGRGVLADPYLIDNEAHLNNIRCRPNSFFRLTRDIKIDRFNSFVPIGAGLAAHEDCPDTPFRGDLDGRGHAICDLRVSMDGAEGPVGLFAEIEGAQIRALDLVEANIQGGAGSTGGLAGRAVSSQIHDVTVYGTIDGDTISGGLVGRSEGTELTQTASWVILSGGQVAGGLVGYMLGGQISEAFINSGYIFLVGQPELSAVGGLVGWAESSGLIERFAVEAQVEGAFNLGGAIGLMDGPQLNVRNGYTSGVLIGTSSGGGLIGLHYDSEQIHDVISGMELSGVVGLNVGAIIGAEMSEDELPFESVYYVDEGVPCVGGLAVDMGSCEAVSSPDGRPYLWQPDLPPMSGWDAASWTFQADMEPWLTRVRLPRGECDEAP